MHPRLTVNLCPSIIQRVTGRVPSRTITAPEPCAPVRSMLSEDERRAQFAHSEAFHRKNSARWAFTYIEE